MTLSRSEVAELSVREAKWRGRLRAQDAVEPTRISPAPERELAAVENDGRHADRAGPSGQQGRGLLGDARRVASEVVALDELPAFGALVPPNAIGIGALLHLALVDGRGLDAAAGLDEVLL
jgi:hypothetical protein